MLAVEVAALIASDGPRRGLRLLTWKGLLMAVPWLAAGVVADLQESGAFGVTHISRYLVPLAIIGIAATLASAKARRLLLLFAIPVSPFVVSSGPTGRLPSGSTLRLRSSRWWHSSCRGDPGSGTYLTTRSGTWPEPPAVPATARFRWHAEVAQSHCFGS